ncbi:hypothetical protein [Alteribacter keqinensis]|uniref:Oligosaccharide repeat unit polymerase n=1 Tax=Alteribacter keqinensis TaxID=2483800 RepID=A0A3M7TQ18_9BACI|nr:hypothetical protein [Alteribacter keqinensis]RNA67734.1 hypothetical protein EBO34_13540 [Alteribacter keqinensis]
MIGIFYYFTLVVMLIYSVFLLFRSMNLILNGYYRVIYFIVIIFYIFFVVPSIMNVVFGVPEYSSQPAFSGLHEDFLVSGIYNLYIIYISFIFHIFGKNSNISSYKLSIYKVGGSKGLYLLSILVAVLFLFSPVLLLLFAPDPSVYLNYGVSTRGLLDGESQDFHNTINLFTRIASFSALFFIFIIRKHLIQLIIILSPYLFIIFWLNGKRSIVISFLLLLIIILIMKGMLKGLKGVVVGVGILIICISFFFGYQQIIDNLISYDLDRDHYQDYRVNFGRDDVTKLTILSELDDNRQILEKRGQSFIFYLTIFVPRELWNEKPLPYAQYMTSAIFNTEPRLWGWGMTTSVLEEFIANLGFIGGIIAPFSIITLARIGDRASNSLLFLFTILITIFFLTVHLSSFFVLFVIWAVWALKDHFKNKVKIVA